ncbi:MAG TPA: HAMP domain-containing sensor histidine kinase [Flavisolibacter sp.]|nr:HAMP domain-containing sensor histidine kinase [Flavisolibacter sp.]
MHKLRNIKWMPALMALTILAIAAFQFYWLQKAYERESKSLERQTNILFRETIASLQANKLLKLDRLPDTSKTQRIRVHNELTGKTMVVRPVDQKMVSIINAMTQRAKDSGQRIYLRKMENDTVRYITKGFSGRRERMMQFLFDVDSLQDSIRLRELQSAYVKRLDEQNLNIPFSIMRVPTQENKEPVYNEVTLGFTNPITYRLELGSTSGFLLKRISVPILFSVFLVGFTLLSFTLVYRNLLKQRRLSDIKNEFISNITHELKTPIATVSVAIEALRSFNANMDANRTKEYLDISANELQRLSLLVDKVLKLSMFEKKEIELKYELLDMKDLVGEVTSSMRLQFEKYKAVVNVDSAGDTSLEGDRLHLVSVIFNLIDNALKYSNGNPRIDIGIRSAGDRLLLTIADTGIGIPAEYQPRIFEKFFRVPTGNLHNAKGYGLGLSYVAHVVSRHKGTINVESADGQGSRFVISLPKRAA